MARQEILMAAIGKKGVGKTWQHMYSINEYVTGNPYTGLLGRKCLIMDVNDEYGVFGVQAISLEHVALFSVHGSIEVRRIRPLRPDGSRLTLDEWANALFYVLQRFRNGMLVIEDLNKFIGDHIPHDLVGAICTNRHAGLDILMSYQSIGRVNTKIWGNLNILRFHKNIESVARHAPLKFPDKFEFMRIAEIMVNDQYDAGNKRFFVYIDMDESKIKGEGVDALFDNACIQYINENPKLLKPYEAMQDEKGVRKHSKATTKTELLAKLRKQYL
jgi:hypothetical protein